MSKGHRNIIGVITDSGAAEWHILNPVAGPDYLTACGLDGDDPRIGQHGPAKPPSGTRVTCAQCYQSWIGFRTLRLRESDFAPESKRAEGSPA